VSIGAGARAQKWARACAREALLIQHGTPLHIVFRSPSISKKFRHYLLNGTIFGKDVTEHKMCFDFFYTFYLKYFSF
jgi:hypothetical protein